MEYQSNYDKQCEDWRKKFLTMNQEDILRRLPEIDTTENELLIWHYGRRFAVNRENGEIRSASDDKPVDVMPKLNIYTLFWYAKEYAVQTGKWVPFRELKDASPFGKAFQNGILDPLAATFSGQEAVLEKAVEALRGKRESPVSFLLPAFACMPVKLNFWDADEEFSAQSNLLFDSGAVNFNHVESIVTIATEALYQLAEAADLHLKGSPFFRF